MSSVILFLVSRHSKKTSKGQSCSGIAASLGMAGHCCEEGLEKRCAVAENGGLSEISGAVRSHSGMGPLQDCHCRLVTNNARPERIGNLSDLVGKRRLRVCVHPFSACV